MFTAKNFDDVKQNLVESFNDLLVHKKPLHLCGLIFADLSDPKKYEFIKTQILDKVLCLDMTSWNHIDFFAMGYESFGLNADCQEWVCRNIDAKWNFNKAFFDESKKHLIENSLVTSSDLNNISLVIMDVKLEENNTGVELLYKTSWVLNLEALVEIKKVFSVCKLYEDISYISEKLESKTPTHDLKRNLSFIMNVDLIEHLISFSAESEKESFLVMALKTVSSLEIMLRDWCISLDMNTGTSLRNYIELLNRHGILIPTDWADYRNIVAHGLLESKSKTVEEIRLFILENIYIIHKDIKYIVENRKNKILEIFEKISSYITEINPLGFWEKKNPIYRLQPPGNNIKIDNNYLQSLIDHCFYDVKSITKGERLALYNFHGWISGKS